MDASVLEREADEAQRFIRDPACQRLWLEVVQQGTRPTSHMHHGVPWFRLTEAIDAEVKKTLVGGWGPIPLRSSLKGGHNRYTDTLDRIAGRRSYLVSCTSCIHVLLACRGYGASRADNSPLARNVVCRT
jgi:hypothetical protein